MYRHFRWLGLFVLVVVFVQGCGKFNPRNRNAITVSTSVPNKPDYQNLRTGEFASMQISVPDEEKGRIQRNYRLVVPKSVAPDSSVPLVIAFHGIAIDSKDLMPKYTHLNETAEKHGFVLVYPDAIEKSWGLTPDKTKKDIALFDALLKELPNKYPIDLSRVYVLGMSNGGYFAHLIGKERSLQIAAVASHSGPLGLQTLFGIHAERKFPVLIIHGDKDQIFPVAFARENRDKYSKEGHAVKYVEIPDLGHFWGEKVNINETIWQFFNANPLPKK